MPHVDQLEYIIKRRYTVLIDKLNDFTSSHGKSIVLNFLLSMPVAKW